MPLAYDAPIRLGWITPSRKCWACPNTQLMYGYWCKFCDDDAYQARYKIEEGIDPDSEANSEISTYYIYKFQKYSDEWRCFLKTK